MPRRTTGSVYRTARPATASAGPRTAGARTAPASRPRPRPASGSPRTSPRGSTAAPRRRRSPSTRSATCSSTATARPSPTRTRQTLEERLAPARERVRRLDAARARGRRRRHRPLAGRADRHVPLPADAGAAAGARRRRPLALPEPQPGRRRRPQPGAARRGAAAVHAATRSTRSPPSSARSTGRSSSSPPRPGCGRTSGSALERRDVDRSGPAVTVQRRYADGVADAVPEDGALAPACAAHRPRALERSRRCRRGSTRRCCSPPPRGGHIGLDNWRTREWYPALDAAGIDAARPVPPAPHVRDRGARRRRLDLRAGAADGRHREDDRQAPTATSRATPRHAIRARLDARART